MVWVLLLCACGARTGPLVPDGFDAAGDAAEPSRFQVRIAVHCGNCLTRRWCASGASGTEFFCDENTPGFVGTCQTECTARGFQWVGTTAHTRRAFTVDGTTVDLYCVGDTTRQTDLTACGVLGPANSSVWRPDPCLWGRMAHRFLTGRPPPWPESERASRCGATPYSCGNGFGGQPPRPALAQLQCPKGDVPDPEGRADHPQCVQRYDVFARDEADARIVGGRLLAGYASMWGASRWAGRLPPGDGPDATGGFPSTLRGIQAPFLCFAPEASLFAGPSLRFPTPLQDPGPALAGHRVTIQSTSRIVVEDGSDPPTIMPLDMSRSLAWVYLDGATSGFSVTDLQLFQAAGNTTTVAGYAVADGELHLESTWTGTYTAGGALPNIAMNVPSTVAQGTARVNGRREYLRGNATTAEGHYDGSSQLDLTLRYRPDPGMSLAFRLELHMQVHPRPTATITSVSSLTPACTRFADGTVGADVTANASRSPASAIEQWSMSGISHLDYATGASVTMRARLHGPSDPGDTLSFGVLDGPLAAYDTRTIQVVDAVAPAITAAAPEFDCGWGGLSDTGNPPLCMRIGGTVTDNCSAAHVEITRWVEHPGCDRAVVLRSGQGGNCIASNPLYRGSPPGSPSAGYEFPVYEVTYRVVDAWGNASAEQSMSYRVAPAAPNATCGGDTARTIVTNPCGWSGPMPAPARNTIVATEGGHTCAIRDDGRAWCWGRNDYGQSENGAATGCTSSPLCDRWHPVDVGVDNAVQVVGGLAHSCARRADGSVRCWGANFAGQLGDGTTAMSSAAVTASILSVSQLAAVGNSMCALKTDGTVWCWGENSNGQLGNGTYTSSSVPVQVTGLSGVVEIAGAGAYACARDSAGTIRCWGSQSCGVGPPSCGQTAPQSITAPTNGVQLAVGWGGGGIGACVLDSGGQVSCWHDFGSASQVAGLDNVTDISAAYFHACARRRDATVLCWGTNEIGERGSGRSDDDDGPPSVMFGVADATAVSAGYFATCVRRSDHSLWCTGLNDWGVHGNGTMLSTPIPVRSLFMYAP